MKKLKLKNDFKESLKKHCTEALYKDHALYTCIILYDCNRGIYIHKAVLEDILANCELSESEEKDIINLVESFDSETVPSDFEGIVYYEELYESLVSEILEDKYYLGFSEQNDYGIFKYYGFEDE